jgi:hypothetical protein
MQNHPSFPSDATGNTLMRLLEAGDSLTQPRAIEFCYCFETRQNAMAFAIFNPDKEVMVCRSIADGHPVWQTIVKIPMLPEYQAIIDVEQALAAKATAFDGKPDGWGCFPVTD